MVYTVDKNMAKDAILLLYNFRSVQKDIAEKVGVDDDDVTIVKV